MRIMDWMKQVLAPKLNAPPQRIFDIWHEQDAELEDAKARVARLLEEMESRNLRTHL